MPMSRGSPLRRPFDGGLDQSRRDECHRYRHVDLTNSALLARGNAFDAGSARDDLVEPGTSARDGFDQLARASTRSCRCWKRAASEVCKCEEVESGLGQTEPLKLQRPFVRRITQVGDADAARTSRVQLKPIGGPVAYSISRLVLALEMLAWAHSVLYKDIL